MNCSGPTGSARRSTGSASSASASTAPPDSYNNGPPPREGGILKRAGWRFYSPDALAHAYNGDVTRLPPFRRIVHSWDTSFKEKTSSDYVAGGWGSTGATASCSAPSTSAPP